MLFASGEYGFSDPSQRSTNRILRTSSLSPNHSDAESEAWPRNLSQVAFGASKADLEGKSNYSRHVRNLLVYPSRELFGGLITIDK